MLPTMGIGIVAKQMAPGSIQCFNVHLIGSHNQKLYNIVSRVNTGWVHEKKKLVSIVDIGQFRKYSIKSMYFLRAECEKYCLNLYFKKNTGRSGTRPLEDVLFAHFVQKLENSKHAMS